ncbi:MAG: hypothetical protein RLZZ292_3000 [Bacteroidota bacterium]|jgi:hypothetical protein
MKNLHQAIIINAVLLFVYLGILVGCMCFVQCKKQALELPEISQFDDIGEIIIEDAELAENVIDEDETEATAKIMLTGQKANIQNSGCNPKKNTKYKDYLVAIKNEELNFSLINSNDSIISVTSNYITLEPKTEGRTKNNVDLIMRNINMSTHKPWTIKFEITLSSGKVIKKYKKMLPTISAWEHAQFGTSTYYINYYLFNAKKISTIEKANPVIRYGINENWTPQESQILCFGQFSQTHYAIISNKPVQVRTRINGILKNVWKFKVKSQNENCDSKTITRTILWSDGVKIASLNIERDSCFQYMKYEN